MNLQLIADAITTAMPEWTVTFGFSDAIDMRHGDSVDGVFKDHVEMRLSGGNGHTAYVDVAQITYAGVDADSAPKVAHRTHVEMSAVNSPAMNVAVAVAVARQALVDYAAALADA